MKNAEINDQNWKRICKIFKDTFTSSFYYSFASVDESGTPHVSPIGSLILRPDKTGYYFEKNPRLMPANFEHNKKVCVMAVNMSKWPFMKFFLSGKLREPFGVRLIGTVGEKRPATPDEMDAFLAKVRPYRFFRGHKLLWRKLRDVRDITFDSFEPVNFGALTKDLWD